MSVPPEIEASWTSFLILDISSNLFTPNPSLTFDLKIGEKVKRFKDTLNGGSEWKKFKPTEKQKKEIDKIIDKSIKAATELGAKGTPSFYDKDMKLIKNRGSLFK